MFIRLEGGSNENLPEQFSSVCKAVETGLQPKFYRLEVSQTSVRTERSASGQSGSPHVPVVHQVVPSP